MNRRDFFRLAGMAGIVTMVRRRARLLAAEARGEEDLP